MSRSSRALVLGAVALLSCVLASGCSGDDGGGSPEATETTTTAEVPSPVATVIHTFTNGDPYLRFAVELSNPGSRTLVGVETAWKALDANGVIVGTVEGRAAPPIPPGGIVLDTGGAGGVLLTGTPATVRVEIVDKGEFVDVAPDPSVAVASAPTFSRAEFDLNDGARDYDVQVTVEALTEVNTEDLSVAVVLRDATGTAIGSDFGDTTELPSRLAPGDKVNVTAIVSVTNGEPAVAQVEAHA